MQTISKLILAFLFSFYIDICFSQSEVELIPDSSGFITNKHYKNNMFSRDWIFNKLNIDSSVFYKDVSFDNVQILKEGRIWSCNFHNDAFFFDVTFPKEFYLHDIKFARSPHFSFCQLPKTLHLSSLRLDSLDGVIDFSTCRTDSLKKYIEYSLFIEEKCLVYINIDKNSKNINTFFEKVIIPSNLFTLGTTSVLDYDGYDNFEDVTMVYENLIKQSKQLGLIKSQVGWEIEYIKFKNTAKLNFFKIRRNKYEISLLPFGSILNKINELWWNFSYSKYKILFIWLPSFFILFFLINFFKFEWLINKVYRNKKFGENFNINPMDTLSLNEKVSICLFYTAMIYFHFKLDSEAINYKNLKGVIYLYTIYIVGTIHVTFGIFSYILK